MFSFLKDKIKKFITEVEKKEADKEKKEISEGEKEALKETCPEEKREEKKPEKIEISTFTKIKSFFSKKIRLSEADLESTLNDLRISLIESDVALNTADKICSRIKSKLLEKEIEKDKLDLFIRNTIKEVLLDILKKNEMNFMEYCKNLKKPVKIVFFGINGTGKTTTISKLGNFLTKNKKTVVFVAGDTFRAGAIEQISVHSERLNIKLIKPNKRGADATAVIFDGVEYAKAHYIDFVLADTAGRMQTNKNLMEEMKKICRVIKPDLKIFIADALTGNDALEQARNFNKEIGIDAIILTKMDIAKGGCALSIADEIEKPIIFAGVGQRYDDIEEFKAEWFVDNVV